MSTIFDVERPVIGLAPPRRLRVAGRHVKPCTDELLFLVYNSALGEPDGIVLSRPTVRQLHAVLGRWLEEGWPRVAKSEDRLDGAV